MVPFIGFTYTEIFGALVVCIAFINMQFIITVASMIWYKIYLKLVYNYHVEIYTEYKCGIANLKVLRDNGVLDEICATNPSMKRKVDEYAAALRKCIQLDARCATLCTFHDYAKNNRANVKWYAKMSLFVIESKAYMELTNSIIKVCAAFKKMKIESYSLK
jgi:hypothetical protein